MGRVLAPLIANIFVDFHDRQLFDKICKPYFFFISGTLMIRLGRFILVTE